MSRFMNFQGPTFTMQVPTNWLITSSPKLQAIFVAPRDENNVNEAKVQPNLIVSIRRLTEEATAEAIAEATKITQQKEYADYQVQEEKDISKGDLSGVYRAYTWYKEDEDIIVSQHQAFYVAAQVLYTLTATRPGVIELQKLDEIFSTMIQSFEVTT